MLLPLDVTAPDQMDALFDRVASRWGGLDFLLHSIAFAPKEDLHGRVTDSSADGFASAMDVSCHSLIRLAHRAEPLMQNGGAILTMSFYGSEKVVPGYGIMGPVKAALEASVRYLATSVGPRGIRASSASKAAISRSLAALRSRAVGISGLVSENHRHVAIRRFVWASTLRVWQRM